MAILKTRLLSTVTGARRSSRDPRLADVSHAGARATREHPVCHAPSEQHDHEYPRSSGQVCDECEKARHADQAQRLRMSMCLHRESIPATHDGLKRAFLTGAPSVKVTSLSPARTLRLTAGKLVTVALAVVVLAVPVSAEAASTHPFSSFNGEPGAHLANPWGIDVDSAAGTVLVADSSNHQVAKFDLSGAPKEFSSLSSNELSGAGAPESFEAPTPYVGDVPGGGDVYAVDFPHNVVDRFNAAGEYVSQLTGAGTPAGAFSGPFEVRVDPSSGDVWVIDTGHDVVDEFSSATSETYLGQIDASSLVNPSSSEAEPLTGLQDIAIDSEGNLYLAGNNETAGRFQVDKFNGARELQFVLDPNGATSVAVDTGTLPNTVYTIDAARTISAYESTSISGVPVEQFGPGEDGNVELQDVAVDSVSHKVYATDYGDSQVDVFAPKVVLPTPVTGEASEVQPLSATLSGTVNPEGVELSECVFEYGETESYGKTMPCQESDAAIGTGPEPVAVKADVTGLQVGTSYHFRLMAANVNGSEHGADATFATQPPPTVSGAAANSITETSADLTALINPNGAQTGYHVDYGTTTAYGTTQPVPDAPAGAGSAPKTVSVPITGLKANVTYHWRLVATSAAGTVSTADQTFVDDTTGAGLPDGRAYELVTPPRKNGALIDVALGGGSAWAPRIAENGKDLIAPSIQCFAGAESCVGVREREGEAYEFARTPTTGWVTNPLAPPAAMFETNTLWAANANQRTTLFSAPSPPAGEDDFYTRNAEGHLADIGPVGEGLTTYRKIANIDATSDFTHVLYSGSNLWSIEAGVYEYAGFANTAPRPVGVTGGPESTSLVSSCRTILASGALSGPFTQSYGPLSADGRTAYFTAEKCPGGTGENASKPVPAKELYARVDGEQEVSGESGAHSVLISAPTVGVCESVKCEENNSSEPEKQKERARDSIFEGGATDGSRVFFTSTQQFTDHADEGEGGAGQACHEATLGGCNLYESVCAEPCGTPKEEPAAKGRELIDVSEANGATQASGGPRVQGVLAISPDGTHVYFVARGVLTEVPNTQEQVAQDGKDNLYAYERDTSHPAGRLSFIATLATADEGELFLPRAVEWNKGIGLANVTPDGRFLVFVSHGALTPDDTRPAEEGKQAPPAQIYRYDDETGTLVRISIGERGYNDNGNAGTQEASVVSAQRGWALGVGPGRADPTMSHDGQYVFFESPVGLAPGAIDDDQVTINNQGQPEYAENIYEYHDGNVSLISDGKDASAKPGAPGAHSSVELLGSDATGANVFFTTFDQLTPQDTDTQRDYYDARICTSEEPCPTYPSPALACSEEACHGAAAGSPAGQTPASATFNGPGNLTPPPPAPAVKPKSLTRAQKLAKALKACRMKHNRHRRSECERAARHLYGAAAKAGRSAHVKHGSR